GKLALVDLEDEVDSVLRELNDFWLDRSPKPSLPAVEIEDAFDIVLHPRPGIDDARTQLDLGIQILVVELAITFDGDSVDDWIFDDLDDQSVANTAQIDVSKQTGGEKRLERLVHLFIVPRITRLDEQVGANCFGLDPLNPLYSDIANRSSAYLG